MEIIGERAHNDGSMSAAHESMDVEFFQGLD